MVKIQKLKVRFKSWFSKILQKFKAYIRRLLFPLYLFPIKLLTYSAYYAVKLLIKLLIKSLKIAWHMVSWPFRKWINFFKTIFWILFGSLNLSMLFVLLYIINAQYGSVQKFFCFGDIDIKNNKPKIVRIIGSYSQGSGFFITPTEVITNFHVIEGESSPKVVLPEGTIETPINLVGDKNADLAKITLSNKHENMVLPVIQKDLAIAVDEQLFSYGYPIGSNIKGGATVSKGQFTEFRHISGYDSSYIQANINIEKGMSGGPLIEACGEVVGINQLGLNGLSLFISSLDLFNKIPTMTDKDISKKELHPEKSPSEAVYAYYTYIGARNMEQGFKLLSSSYLQKTNFDEWTRRFSDILNVTIYQAAPVVGTDDVVTVKFSTDNWVNGSYSEHYYEGIWHTVKEDGVYKMLKSKILEVENPDYSWFYVPRSEPLD